ncbi:6-phosphofructokinase [Pseudothermotoga thermarum]|uniref:6-phosphofructokinase n=1 Tax=Pseudothermotoga thermarum DSM 5069 TaxID=688269 RepID=F7YWF7_9THEM|nr:6-phosphofructokinase [Pseudothermotoga thermarum]AEH51935.1 6-phosphofructokinase [Pseudothermotoga thermarum DSM 5069]
MRRIAILCVGNDCPGLNAAIRATVVKSNMEDLEVVGVKDGFEGLLRDQLDVLTRNSVSGILHRGGTILGTSLYIPESDEEVNKVVEKVKQYSITCLLILGGRIGTRAALRLMKANVPSILIPATIDNDLPFTDFSIGFFTAVSHVTDALDMLHSTAEAHHRVMIVETMGRPSGWIATVGGLAGGADYVITNAEGFKAEDLLAKIRSRYEGHKRFSIVVVEDGLKLDQKFYEEVGVTQETPPAKVIGMYIQKALKDINIEWRYTSLGYLQRGGSPVSMDRIIATMMATRAVEMVKAARVYHAVGMRGFTVTEVPYSESMLNLKIVDEYLRNLAKLFY